MHVLYMLVKEYAANDVCDVTCSLDNLCNIIVCEMAFYEEGT